MYGARLQHRSSDLIAQRDHRVFGFAAAFVIERDFRSFRTHPQQRARRCQRFRLYRSAVDSGNHIPFLQAALFSWTANRDGVHEIAVRRRIDPHAGTVKSTDISGRWDDGFEVHRLVRVIERNDEALEKTASNIAKKVRIAYRAGIGRIKRGDDAFLLLSAKRQERQAHHIRLHGPTNTPARYSGHAARIFLAKLELLHGWRGDIDFAARSGV